MWRPTFNNSLLCAWKLLGGFALLFMLLVHAQQDDDQSGFISIDCGLADNSSYSDETTGINYISDARFVDTGERQWPEYYSGYRKIYQSLRSFPQGRRNCYRIKVTSGTKYLIRALFLYGNYDGENKLPEFQLHLGPNFWATVRLIPGTKLVTFQELIHYVPAVQNYIHVCLVNTGSGVPFISALELRPLPNSTYPELKNNSLALINRRDTGGNREYRYPLDKLDRLWSVDYNRTDWSQLNTFKDITDSDYSSQPPSIVMKSAATPKNRTGSLDLYWEKVSGSKTKFLYYLHFAEVEKLPPNQSRLQYISKDGELFHEPFALSYLETTTISWRWSLTQNTTFSISKTKNSTIPPILNALEVYLVKEFSVSETNQEDVDAITDIKSAYKIKRNRQGDPCVPRDYIWEGVSCSSYENERPRIISLNLSSSGLTGEILPSIFNLTMIQTMDLSNNNLTGSVPEHFSQLPKLKTLNLEKNNLRGSIPGGLIQRRKHGLSLSLCDNPYLSEQVSCKKKKHNINIIAVAGTIFGILILLSTVAAVLWGFKRKRQQAG
ncbi:hypothetical protein M0R45_036287 [Rubus argutus]|uniref:Malectin-like domain-containing protein n=1 Tax=Rubus argutus TaxID=59490 RepID=A0AAW1VWK1_RUBAR